MRHFYFRLVIGMVWLAAAVVSALSSALPMVMLYLALCAVFLLSARSIWKKEKGDKKQHYE